MKHGVAWSHVVPLLIVYAGMMKAFGVYIAVIFVFASSVSPATGGCGLAEPTNGANNRTRLSLNHTSKACPLEPSSALPVCQLSVWRDLPRDSRTQYIQIGWTRDDWNDSLDLTSLDDVKEVFWNDICREYQDILTTQGHTKERWNARIHKAAGAKCQLAAWNELSKESRNEYDEEEWSAQEWNAQRWLYSRKQAEEILWGDLCSPYQRELQARGWNEVAWNEDDVTKLTFYNEAELDWEELPADRRLHYTNNGIGRREYQREYRNTEDGSHNDVLAPAADFLPRVIPLKVPQVQALNFTYLSSLDVDIGLRESVQDRETESFIESAQLREYISRIQGGEASTYSQVEDDRYTEQLWKPIGSKVIKYLRYALKTSDIAKQNGQYKRKWVDIDESKFGWGMFMGGKGTTTSMHFDTDAFNFLYVVEGRKRIIMLENTGLVNETRFNISSFFHGSAWTDLNILKPENRPEGTVVLEIGPGEGVAIPYRAWHAAENLEHSVAYALRLT